MVAQIVSKIIGQLGSVLTEELKRRGKLAIGAQKDVKKLASTFSAIEALLLDAEERQLTDKAVQDWVTKLKSVCYKIDDVLDEWRTEILKHQIEGGDDDDDDNDYGWLELKLLEISDLLKRVCPFLPAYCFSPDEIGVRYDIASKIKELYEDLEHIDKNKNMFNFAAKPAAALHKSLPTSSIIKFSDVRGREEETELLKEKLLQISDDVQSISIQGAGGLGKTTLAKLLYNDKVVGDHFDKRIWVCVSDTFDPTTVAKTILESLTGSAPQSNTLSIMLEDISKRIQGMRFLLVLDDVWEDSRSKWEELRNVLSCNTLGSKILATTRKGEVSRALGCVNDDVILIRKVSEDVCQVIFTQVAFHGWTAVEQLRLEGLCKDVVNKCDGSPLAAKVLGGVMQSKKRKSEWLKVLKSEMWHLQEVREEVFGPLALSYYDLTPELRQCFQFCAVFPKDYELDKNKLTKLWISQGFVRARGDQEVEDIGEEYFQILAARSFFQDFRYKEVLGVRKTYCKMHDLVHDFAQMLNKNECICMTNKDMEDGGYASSNHDVVGNLRIDNYDFVSRSSIKGSLFSSMKDLRSFMTNSVYNIEPDVWGHLCGIRSLVLTDSWLKEIPSTVNQLIHIRHLDLSNNMLLEALPEEICELYNLWTLIINRCCNLKKLPHGMGNKLVNLKHLENEQVPASLPKSIGRLTRLKTLTEFRICKHQRERGTTIVDLKNMNQLQGSLSVVGLSNVSECYEVEQADFANKAFLTRLALEFRDGGRDDEASGIKDVELLEAVRPSINLEEVIITGYMGASISPRWILSLSNLTRLLFVCCNEVKYLPPLGGLQSLEKLSFIQMGKVDEVGVELLGHEQQPQHGNMMIDIDGAFPRLSVLQFVNMSKWKGWDDTMLSSPSVMPRLHSLMLDNCNELKKLPDAILQKPTLQRLEVNDCDSLQMVISEVWDEISHIPTIIFNEVDVRTRHRVEMNIDW